jgi:hypothetical protein
MAKAKTDDAVELQVKRGDQVLFFTALAADEKISLNRSEEKIRQEDDDDAPKRVIAVLDVGSPDREPAWDPQTNFESQRRNMRVADPERLQETGTTAEVEPQDRELQDSGSKKR